MLLILTRNLIPAITIHLNVCNEDTKRLLVFHVQGSPTSEPLLIRFPMGVIFDMKTLQPLSDGASGPFNLSCFGRF